MNISFYPGPSTVYPEIPVYVNEAYEEGVLSLNHRSAAFSQILKKAIELLKEKLLIPDDYVVMFTSSATECWEIIAQSLITSGSFHIYNGEFGKKWFQYTSRICPDAKGKEFTLEHPINVSELEISSSTDVVCLTHNETSNGTEVSLTVLKEMREAFAEKLIAIDATSSMAGSFLDFQLADIWFGSVQKCFGLPAGLGLMICSPKAISRALEINESKHYNSLGFIYQNILNLQTHYTPNVLGIYLMMRVMNSVDPIKVIDKKLQERNIALTMLFKDFKGLEFLCSNSEQRSKTVLALKGDAEFIFRIKESAQQQGITLGSGYGAYKAETFRIANFPAIPEAHFDILEKFLKSYKIKEPSDH